MTLLSRRRLVTVLFLSCVGALLLMAPRDASAQNRRRDRERRIAADAAAAAAGQNPTTRLSPLSDDEPPATSAPSHALFMPPPNSARTAYSEHFTLLTQKNIFLRNRPSLARSVRTGPVSPGPAAYEKPPEESLVLTGIVLQSDRPIAFIENQSSGATQRLTIGDPIARGEISQIGIDFLEYQTADDQVTRVEIGRTFTGGAPAVAAAATTAPGSATASASSTPDDDSDNDDDDKPKPPPAVKAPLPATSAPTDPNKANLSLEEKMKLKRLQELKK